MPQLVVVVVSMKSGERMPLLCDAESGLGLFEPTAYALNMRSRGRAVNTISQALRSVQLLYQILSANGVDLIERAKANELLTLGEIEAVVDQCRMRKADLDSIHHRSSSEHPTQLSDARIRRQAKERTSLDSVDSSTALIRLKYITQYLAWFTEYAYLQKLPKDRELFNRVAQKAVKALSARSPVARQRSSAARKRGLDDASRHALLELTKPDSASNPWSMSFLQQRNDFIIRLLLGTGMRKGEMLGLKVGDINLSESKVFIARRADDPEDPRRIQPATKTYDRELRLGSDLMSLIKQYLPLRAQIPKAKKHPYLIVSHNGSPLSINSVDLVFATLRSHLPDVPQLSAHILRHTWNNRFSELVEGVLTPEQEKKVRNYIMGWSDQSRSAENYTVRYVEQQANKALIDIQSQLFEAAK